MSPKDDHFLSVSSEGVKLWTITQDTPIALIDLAGESSICATFDAQGLVFAIGINSNSVRLYDAKKYATGPFSTFSIDMVSKKQFAHWESMEFSQDGKLILISTRGLYVYIIDAFKGELKCTVRLILRLMI